MLNDNTNEETDLTVRAQTILQLTRNTTSNTFSSYGTMDTSESSAPAPTIDTPETTALSPTASRASPDKVVATTSTVDKNADTSHEITTLTRNTTSKTFSVDGSMLTDSSSSQRHAAVPSAGDDPQERSSVLRADAAATNMAATGEKTVMAAPEMILELTRNTTSKTFSLDGSMLTDSSLRRQESSSIGSTPRNESSAGLVSTSLPPQVADGDDGQKKAVTTTPEMILELTRHTTSKTFSLDGSELSEMPQSVVQERGEPMEQEPKTVTLVSTKTPVDSEEVTVGKSVMTTSELILELTRSQTADTSFSSEATTTKTHTLDLTRNTFSSLGDTIDSVDEESTAPSTTLGPSTCTVTQEMNETSPMATSSRISPKKKTVTYADEADTMPTSSTRPRHEALVAEDLERIDEAGGKTVLATPETILELTRHTTSKTFSIDGSMLADSSQLAKENEKATMMIHMEPREEKLGSKSPRKASGTSAAVMDSTQAKTTSPNNKISWHSDDEDEEAQLAVISQTILDLTRNTTSNTFSSLGTSDTVHDASAAAADQQSSTHQEPKKEALIAKTGAVLKGASPSPKKKDIKEIASVDRASSRVSDSTATKESSAKQAKKGKQKKTLKKIPERLETVSGEEESSTTLSATSVLELTRNTTSNTFSSLGTIDSADSTCPSQEEAKKSPERTADTPPSNSKAASNKVIEKKEDKKESDVDSKGDNTSTLTGSTTSMTISSVASSDSSPSKESNTKRKKKQKKKKQAKAGSDSRGSASPSKETNKENEQMKTNQSANVSESQDPALEAALEQAVIATSETILELTRNTTSDTFSTLDRKDSKESEGDDPVKAQPTQSGSSSTKRRRRKSKSHNHTISKQGTDNTGAASPIGRVESESVELVKNHDSDPALRDKEEEMLLQRQKKETAKASEKLDAAEVGAYEDAVLAASGMILELTRNTTSNTFSSDTVPEISEDADNVTLATIHSRAISTSSANNNPNNAAPTSTRRRSEQPPGAVRVRGPGAREAGWIDDDDDDDEEEETTDLNSTEQLIRQRTEQLLLEAELVADGAVTETTRRRIEEETRARVYEEFGEFAEAEALDENKAYNNSVRSNRALVWGAMCLIIGVIVAIAVVFAVSGNGGNEPGQGLTDASPTSDPTTAPPTVTASESPTGQPTVLSEYNFLLRMLETISGDQLVVEGTAQNKAFNWLLNEDPAILDIKTEQLSTLMHRYALATFYYSTNGPQWPNQLNFLSEESVCEWHSGENGVECPNGNLSVFRFAFVGLDGTLPSELSILSALTEFSISNEDFLIGTIPSEIGLLTRLQTLTFAETPVEGSVQSTFNSLKDLHSLHIFRTQVSGTLPELLSLDNSLARVVLPFNQFRGSMPPIRAASRLVWLILNGNLRLGGTIPETIYQQPDLEWLSLASTSIGGTLATQISNLRRLRLLFVDYAKLTGSLPSSIGNLGLAQFYASGNSLVGTIPTEFGELDATIQLHLDNNFLSGTVPSELVGMTALQELKLDSNEELTGTLPASFAAEWSDIQLFTVHGTRISSGLQTAFCVLPKLSTTHISADCGGIAPRIQCDCCAECCVNGIDCDDGD